MCKCVDKISVREKLDSGAMTSMSGVQGRIVNKVPINDVRIIGFNNSTSAVTAVGMNSDGIREYYVSSMPNDLVLLSGHAYSIGGAVIL